jgi:hypothetical protein
MLYRIRYFLKRVKRAFEYAKLGYNQTAYDYSDILRSLDKALKDLEPSIRNGYGLHGKIHSQKIRVIREYLNRTLNHDEYYSYLTDEDLDKKYGPSDWEFYKVNASSDYWRHTETNPKRRTKTFHTDFRNAIKKSEYFKKHNKDELFRLLSKYLFLFWD